MRRSKPPPYRSPHGELLTDQRTSHGARVAHHSWPWCSISGVCRPQNPLGLPWHRASGDGTPRILPALHPLWVEHLPSEGSLITDQELLIQAASGNAKAFELFVVRHREVVWRFVRSLTREAASAEDALQDTFLSAWRDATRFEGNQSALGWLLTIARHAVYRQHRGRAGEPKRMESLSELGEAAGWGSESDPFDTFVIQDEVGKALARLSLEDREVLVLRESEGFSLEECAALLGLGLPALKSRLHRARLRFIAHLRGERHGN